MSDSRHRIVRADLPLAPMVVELPLGSSDPLAPARCDPRTARAFVEHRPVQAGVIEIDGAPVVAGLWRIDAAPRFETHGGAFLGYVGILRRPSAAPPDAESHADRLRQLVHELRTPLNAIHGFAELIEQQLFGPTPDEYRNLAGAIAADSAAILTTFEELERLARHQIAPDGEAADLASTRFDGGA